MYRTELVEGITVENVTEKINAKIEEMEKQEDHPIRKLLSVMKRSGKKLSELAELMERYPQVMINVKISPRWKEAWKNIPEIEEMIENKEKELDGSGRILVRESGTEPLIRVMIEGKLFETINEMAVEIADVIRRCCPEI